MYQPYPILPLRHAGEGTCVSRLTRVQTYHSNLHLPLTAGGRRDIIRASSSHPHPATAYSLGHPSHHSLADLGFWALASGHCLWASVVAIAAGNAGATASSGSGRGRTARRDSLSGMRSAMPAAAPRLAGHSGGNGAVLQLVPSPALGKCHRQPAGTAVARKLALSPLHCRHIPGRRARQHAG